MDIRYGYRITNVWNNEIICQIKKVDRQYKKRRKCAKSWVVEVVLVQCNLVDNQYQQKSKVLYTFTPNKFSCLFVKTV